MPSLPSQVEHNIYRYALRQRTATGKHHARYMVRLRVRRKEHRKRGFRTIDQARAYLQKANLKAGDVLFNVLTQPTIFRDYADTWLKNCNLLLKANTVRNYQIHLRLYVLPEFGHLPLPDISRPRIKRWIGTLIEKGMAVNSVRLAVAPLRAILSAALDEQLIDHHPGIRLSKMLTAQTLRKTHKKLDAFSREETQAILRTTQTHHPGDYALVLTLFRAGLRVGEAYAVERTDVDFAGRGLIISKNFTNGVLETTTKGGLVRRVDMSLELRAVLKAHLETQDLDAALHHQPLPTLVFPSASGTYLNNRWWREVRWYTILKRAQVRARPPHHARHTYATRLLENGESLEYVRLQLGHRSVQTTQIYSHLVPGVNLQAVDRLDE